MGQHRRALPTQNAKRSVVDEEVGHRVRRAREALGITQKGLGERLGYGVNTLPGYERGDNSMTVPRLIEIANELKIKPSVLLGEHDSTIDEIYSLKHALDKALTALGRL